MIWALVVLVLAAAPEEPAVREGDLIFQTSRSPQSEAIQLATHSPYSHLGVILKHEGHLAVFEAIQPVKATPLPDWIARGDGAHFVVKRLRNADRVLTPSGLQSLRQEAARRLDTPYDPYFGWSDGRLYCSEFVYKIFAQALGVRLGELQTLAEFDLSSPVVQRKLKERYGAQVPLREPVVSPASIFASRLLEEVARR
jgi:hypothetical protein